MCKVVNVYTVPSLVAWLAKSCTSSTSIHIGLTDSRVLDWSIEAKLVRRFAVQLLRLYVSFEGFKILRLL